MADKKNRTYSIDDDTRELLKWFDENTNYNKSETVEIAVKSLYRRHEKGEIRHQGMRADLELGDGDFPDMDGDDNEDSGILDRFR